MGIHRKEDIFSNIDDEAAGTNLRVIST